MSGFAAPRTAGPRIRLRFLVPLILLTGALIGYAADGAVEHHLAASRTAAELHRSAVAARVSAADLRAARGALAGWQRPR